MSLMLPVMTFVYLARLKGRCGALFACPYEHPRGECQMGRAGMLSVAYERASPGGHAASAQKGHVYRLASTAESASNSGLVENA